MSNKRVAYKENKEKLKAYLKLKNESKQSTKKDRADRGESQADTDLLLRGCSGVPARPSGD
jgi:hypothetical protein